MTGNRYDTTLPISERKKNGIFYTPDPVVKYLLYATSPSGPVADISCGDGAFLTAAARAGCRVMGVDQDEKALKRAEIHLTSFPKEQWSLRCGDGLAPDLPFTPQVVLGNPPYIEAKKADRNLKEHCRQLFPDITRGGFDLFICFIKAGLDALPTGGRLGYIIPNKFLIAEYARPLRDYLLRNMTIEQIIDVSDLPTFSDASVYPILLVVKKEPPPARHSVLTGHVTDLTQLDTGTFAKSEIKQGCWLETTNRVFWLPPTDNIARHMIDRLLTELPTVRLAELLDIRWTVSFHRSGLRDQFIFPEPTGKYPRRFLGGTRFNGNADVQRYRIDWSGWWIDYDQGRSKSLGNQLPPLDLFSGAKLCIAQNSRRIIAALDTEEYICKDTFFVGRQPGQASLEYLLGSQREQISLEYLLGLLNSSLLSYIYGTLFKATHIGGAYLHYLPCYLNDLPIVIPDDMDAVCGYVNQLLDPSLSENDREEIDSLLDELVYDLYGLKAEERALVKEAVPNSYAGGKRRGQWDARAVPFINSQIKTKSSSI